MASTSEKQPRDPLPDNFGSLEDFWAFWDTHSSADYEDLMEDVEVEIGPVTSKAYCAIEQDLLRRVRNQAHDQGTTAEKLIHLWLQERLAAA